MELTCCIMPSIAAFSHFWRVWLMKSSNCSHPFIYFPCFFLTKSLVEQRPHPLEHTYNKWRNEVRSCSCLLACQGGQQC